MKAGTRTKVRTSAVCLTLLAVVAVTIGVLGASAQPETDGSRRPGNADLTTDFCIVELDGRLYPYRIFFPSRYQHAPVKEGGPVEESPLVIACHPAGGDETSYFQWKGNADRIQTIAEQRGYIVACHAGPDRSWHEAIDGPPRASA